MQLVIQIGGFDNSTIVAQAIVGNLRRNRSLFGIISRQLGDWTKIRFEFLKEMVWADLKAVRILLDPRDVEDQKDEPVRIIRIISDLGWINDQIANAVRCAVPGEYSLEVCDLRLSSTRE
jgi:hypothetical protein